MSLSALRDALALLLRSSSRPSVELDAMPWQLPSRSIGEIVKATVQGELVNGRSIIEIDGAPFDVKLPIPARAGDTLRLQVLAVAPRLTLAVLPANVSGAPDQVAMSESVRRLAAVLDQLMERTPETAAGRTPVTVDGPMTAARVAATALDVPVTTGRTPATAVDTPVTTARAPVATPEARGPAVRVNEMAQPSVATANTSTHASPREAPLSSTSAQSPVVPGATTPLPGMAATAAAPSTPNMLQQSSPASPGSAPTPGAASLSLSAQAAPLNRAISVAAASPADTVRFAAALKVAVSRSGLFYESHQAQWVAGERPLSELTQEPQAALGRTAEPVHPQTVGLVRQQLEILDTRQLVWFGQVWPDQSMEWRIEEDRKQPGSAPDAPGVWKTSLRLTLPRLGAVTALLSIQGDDVRVAFREVSDDTSSAIAGEQHALRAAFDRAGLQLLDLRVERDET